MSKKELFNAKTQTVEEADFTVDEHNEIVATFADGGTVKFPAGLTQKQFDAAVEAHQAGNEGQEVITEEMEAENAAQRKASLDLIGETEEEATPDEDVAETEAK